MTLSFCCCWSVLPRQHLVLALHPCCVPPVAGRGRGPTPQAQHRPHELDTGECTQQDWSKKSAIRYQRLKVARDWLQKLLAKTVRPTKSHPLKPCIKCVPPLYITCTSAASSMPTVSNPQCYNWANSFACTLSGVRHRRFPDYGWPVVL